jgi:hypothetical protein
MGPLHGVVDTKGILPAFSPGEAAPFVNPPAAGGIPGAQPGAFLIVIINDGIYNLLKNGVDLLLKRF